jgi:preprotein translocase subunit SecF
MRFLGQTNIDFMGLRKAFFVFSLVLIMLGMGAIVVRGLQFGIDFVGGTEIVVEFERAIPVEEVRGVMTAAGFEQAEVRTFGTPRDILIRTIEMDREDLRVRSIILNVLSENFPDNPMIILREDVIGPAIGAELRRDATMAIVIALFAILGYIAIRFKFIYGMGAVAALFHDVLVAVGLLALLNGLSPYLNLEISQNIIAAFLALIGLSVNDTVVIFDRIRENAKLYRSWSMYDIINKSINDTLSRTIITSGTTLVVLIILFVFGGEVTRGFAFTLIIGVLVGTYSSIYIASSLVIEWINRSQQKARVAHKVS